MNLGRYEIVEELGRGAMGIVYKARDPKIGRTVVIKTLRQDRIEAGDLEEFVARFQREAHVGGILSHPAIVKVHDLGQEGEEHYLALEYVAGTNLHALLASRVVMPAVQVVEIVADVAEALAHAHERGVVHRDIKPANLFWGNDGRVRIGDFGVARMDESNLTATGQTLGTPSFMSPEQLLGEKVDGRSDLFSLGVVAYQLLTQRSPFKGRSFGEVARRVLEEDPRPVHVVKPDLPEALSAAVARSLAKDRGERFQTGLEMREAFLRSMGVRRELLVPVGEPTSAPPSPAPDRSERVVPPAPSVEGSFLDGSPAASAPPEAPPSAAPPPAPQAAGRPAIPLWVLLAGVGATGLAFLTGAILVAFLVLVDPAKGPAPVPTPTGPSLVDLLAERDYETVEEIALERLAEDPLDSEAQMYLELARKGMRAQLPDAAPVAEKAPATLKVRLTSWFSGRMVVKVDEIPVLEESFSARATRVFGRVVPGSVRPAEVSDSAVLTAGRRRVDIEIQSRSGRTHTRSVDVDLPEDGAVELRVTANSSGLDVSVR